MKKFKNKTHPSCFSRGHKNNILVSENKKQVLYRCCRCKEETAFKRMPETKDDSFTEDRW